MATAHVLCISTAATGASLVSTPVGLMSSWAHSQKSFGAIGGYIAGNKTLIDCLHMYGHASPYTKTIAPPIITQVVVTSMGIQGFMEATSSASLSLKMLALTNGKYHHPGPHATECAAYLAAPAASTGIGYRGAQSISGVWHSI